MRSTSASAIDSKRSCPVCGRNRARHLFRQSFAQLSGVSLLEGYDVVVCERCGMAFADDVPSQKVFDAYYRDLSKYEYAYRNGKESSANEERFRDTVNMLKRAISRRDSRILEIGCATGRLLALLREEGFIQVQGVDPSPGCAETAWRLHQIPVVAATIFNVPDPSELYDLVIVIGVLEHIEDLRQALTCIRKLLAPKGAVYAEVPDASRLAGRTDAPYQEFSIEHINFFSAVSLSNLFRSNGFRVLSSSCAIRMQHENVTCPAACGMYQKNGSPQSSWTRDEETEPGLVRYIEESRKEDLRVREAIDKGAAGRAILVWGTGSHSQRLLSQGAFDNVEIAGFVDSNPKYHHRKLRGAEIFSPAEILNRKEPILISSCGFQREIREQIQQTLGLKNELLLLYDE